MINKIKENIFLLILIVFSLLFLAINIRINIFRYNNFDFGKFDLGNMTQMVWNASHGRGLYLTDYFGTNLPRWAMSHVDPILYIFVPIFMVFPHALTLVISQLILVTAGALLIFKLANLHINSKLTCLFIALSYLLNPSIGYLTAFTGFHGVTAVIPFFIAGVYFYEKMYKENKFNTKNIVLFWIFMVLTMMGKEQLPSYIAIYGFFILFFRNNQVQKFVDLFKSIPGKLGLSMMLVGVVWFFIAFFVVIPANAHYRIEGYEKFAKSLGINDSGVNDVALPNYFLMRYEEFGTSYLDVFINILLNPKKSISIFFGGDKSENFLRTFEPLAYFPFSYPGTLLIALPDFIINFMTTTDGVGTAEITNHRVSMIIPVLYVSTIFGLLYLSNILKKKIKPKIFLPAASFVMLIFTIYTTHIYNNPVYLWFRDAMQNKIISRVFAKTDTELIQKNLKIGDVVRISELDNNDRECALKIVNLIPDGASVSGPDSLGAHLAKRETYAIFPALFNEADYVIVDVFSRKLLTILDVDTNIIRDVIEIIIKSDIYQLETACGNYFVFKNVGPHVKQQMLPIQERFEYNGTVKLPFFQGLEIVDYNFPKNFKYKNSEKLQIVYHRLGSDADKEGSLDNFLMFTSFVNKKTGEIYQLANLPSFALIRPSDWDQDKYYIEVVEIVMPKFVESGEYMLMIGMGNSIRTRSIYLGDITVD